MGQKEQITPEQLRFFAPFKDFDQDDLVYVSESIEIHTEKPRKKLIQLGSMDSTELFLLEGKLGLEARDGKKSIISSGSESAALPIARMRPRMYNIITLSEVKYLLIDPVLLNPNPSFGLDENEDDMEIVYQPDLAGAADGYGVEEIEHTEDSSQDHIDEIYFSIGSDLKNDKLPLPSLPDVAVRIHSLIEGDGADANTIANAINSDPAIAAKLLKTANSPLYRGTSAFESTQAAVVRLGLGTTRQLITTFAMRSVFQSDNPLLNEHMNRIWKHSIDVASTAYVMARVNRGLNPEQALLAGLLHDVGDIAIIAYAENHPYMLANEGTLEQVMETMRSEIGSMILRKWEFPAELCDAAEKAENWMNPGNISLDYADLVTLAQLHLKIPANSEGELPAISTTPAFLKLKDQALTEDGELAFLVEAHEQIAEMKQLLTA